MHTFYGFCGHLGYHDATFLGDTTYVFATGVIKDPRDFVFLQSHVLTCVVLSHMLDATELHIHVSCYAPAFAHTCTHANSDFPRGSLMASKSLSELLHGTSFFLGLRLKCLL